VELLDQAIQFRMRHRALADNQQPGASVIATCRRGGQKVHHSLAVGTVQGFIQQLSRRKPMPSASAARSPAATVIRTRASSSVKWL